MAHKPLRMTRTLGPEDGDRARGGQALGRTSEALGQKGPVSWKPEPFLVPKAMFLFALAAGRLRGGAVAGSQQLSHLLISARSIQCSSLLPLHPLSPLFTCMLGISLYPCWGQRVPGGQGPRQVVAHTSVHRDAACRGVWPPSPGKGGADTPGFSVSGTHRCPVPSASAKGPFPERGGVSRSQREPLEDAFAPAECDRSPWGRATKDHCHQHPGRRRRAT